MHVHQQTTTFRTLQSCDRIFHWALQLCWLLNPSQWHTGGAFCAPASPWPHPWLALSSKELADQLHHLRLCLRGGTLSRNPTLDTNEAHSISIISANHIQQLLRQQRTHHSVTYPSFAIVTSYHAVISFPRAWNIELHATTALPRLWYTRPNHIMCFSSSRPCPSSFGAHY